MSENYHFNIGSFRCVAVSDGTMTYAPPMFPPPPVFLFVNADREKLTQVLVKHGINIAEWKEWVSPYTCLLIDTGKYMILVDTGAGSLAQSTGRLLVNLKQEGVVPEDINVVILSHGHPDHVGGNLDAKGQPIFAKARWMICKDEWLFWTSDQAERRLDEHSKAMLINIARTNLLPLNGRIDLVDSEVEIIPGIHSIFAPGHTPGLMAISLASEGEQLLCISDVLIHPVHLSQPDWFSAIDVIPDQVIASRRKILEKAALEKSQVMAFHFPFPGLGHIVKKDQGWRWQPV
jgi:glyoxylase-like metal-dependent hydrolase (beta-lactamase superfamily II)